MLVPSSALESMQLGVGLTALMKALGQNGATTTDEIGIGSSLAH